MAPGDIFQAISLIILLFSAVLAVVSIRKFRSSRGIDFVLNAESATDPLHYALVGSQPALIREIYRGFGLDRLSDEECRAFPFMYRMYAHVSRMYFILSAKGLDYGLDDGLRDEFVKAWVNELRLFRDHPAMKLIHERALEARNFNSAFLRLATDVFDEVVDSDDTTVAKETNTNTGVPQIKLQG